MYIHMVYTAIHMLERNNLEYSIEMHVQTI